jgi:hypothetical protein
MVELDRGNPFDILPMVLWQKELYAKRPQLKDLPAAVDVVKASDEFVASFAKGRQNEERYQKHIAGLMKSFHATADALAKSGVRVDAEVREMERQMKSAQTLEKAHRAYLLKLAGLGEGYGGGGYGEGKYGSGK